MTTLAAEALRGRQAAQAAGIKAASISVAAGFRAAGSAVGSSVSA